jgi:hypothetical protein
VPSTTATAQVRQQQHEREVDGDQLLGPQPGVEVAAVDVAEPGDVAVLPGVGLRHPHADRLSWKLALTAAMRSRAVL